MESDKNIRIVQLRVGRGRIINYCYLIVNLLSKCAIVVDPAWDMWSVQDNLRRHQARLRGVLVTHSHFDHIHLAHDFAVAHDCEIHISESEYNFYKLKDDRMILFHGDATLSVGGFEVSSIVTPGHTAGSACYLINDALFTGDTLFNEGCGLCYGPGADAAKMFASLAKLKRLIADDVRVYPGHRYYSDLGLTFGKIKEKNIYLQFDDEAQFVNFRMRKKHHDLFAFS